MTAEASQVKISADLSGLSQVLKIRPESALRIFSRPENHTPLDISTWTDAESAAAIRVAIISWGRSGHVIETGLDLLPRVKSLRDQGKEACMDTRSLCRLEMCRSHESGTKPRG
jgi:hypothetical protein